MSTIREALESAASMAEGGSDGGVEPDTSDLPSGAGVEGGGESVAPEGGAASGDKGHGAGEQSAKSDRARDEHGRFAKGSVEKGGEKGGKTTPAPAFAGASPAVPPGGAARTPTGEGQSLPTPEPLKPPSSWKPAVREKWASLPPDIQQEVLRVDKEVRQVMQDSAEPKKFHQQFREVIAPYEGMIRAEGGDPLRAVGQLLQTAAALRTAPPPHKAQLGVNIVRNFGIPATDLVVGLVKSGAVTIDALDKALAGEPQPNGNGGNGTNGHHFDPNTIAQQIEQNLMQKLATQRQQTMSQRSQQDLEAFLATNPEFFEDVRDEVADLLELAGKRGKQLTLEDAYKKALQLHPEVSEVLKQREAAKAAQTANAATERARAASVSVKSEPGGPVTPQPKGIRGTLEEAWAKQAAGRR